MSGQRAKIGALGLIALALATTAAVAAPGDPDSSFDGDGTRTIDHGGADFATAALVQPDGRLIVAGHGGIGTDVIVTRLNPDGASDPSFDSDGTIAVNLGGSDAASDVARQPDGKIVIAGRTSTAGNQNMAVMRLNAAGTLDTSFDGDGTRAIDHGGADDARAVLVQPDGKILLAGLGTASEDILVMRLNADGSSDLSFDGDGTAVVNLGASDSSAGIALQADGKIVVAGRTTAAGNPNAAVTRLNSNGSLDSSFGRDGTRTIDYGGLDDAAEVLVQPNARIVVAGSGGAGADLEVTRLNPDGSNDASFDGDGTIGVDFGGSDYGSAAALQANGKIVATGSAGGDAAVVRLQPGGSLDTSFSFDGRQTISAGNLNVAYATALQANGRILVAGYTASEGNINWLVGRLEGDAVAAGGGPAVARGAVRRRGWRPGRPRRPPECAALQRQAGHDRRQPTRRPPQGHPPRRRDRRARRQRPHLSRPRERHRLRGHRQGPHRRRPRQRPPRRRHRQRPTHRPSRQGHPPRTLRPRPAERRRRPRQTTPVDPTRPGVANTTPLGTSYTHNPGRGSP